ncbi:MAG: hypothetical protein V5A20_11125 [Salinibacter sp.]|uniref:hypothetical protein n=1 Tax=Salinibacter sp. TaxID=2065818 RepID=UPI002FC31396
MTGFCRPLGFVLAGFLMLGLGRGLQAQEVQLLYDEGGVFSGEKYVTVAHSDAKGTVPPDTGTVRGADRLYLAVRPVGEWAFDIEDKQRLRQITPVQDTSTLSPETLTLIEGEEGARAAVMGIPKSQIDWMTPIVCQHPADTTGGLALNERYAPGYFSLRRAYRTGRRLLRDGAPLKAIDALRPFHDAVEPTFSFVPEARALLDTASAKVLDQTRSRFRALREDLVEEPGADGLARLDSFRVRLDSVRTVLTSYADARPEARTEVRTRIEDLMQSTNQLGKNVRSTYRRKTLRIFMRGTYENPKLPLYLGALTQILLHPETALEASGLQVDRLRPSLLRQPRHSELQKQLDARGWDSEFREVVQLVNENIHERREVFGEEIMESLRLRRPAAHQPYYEIVAAMNAVLAGDQARFTEAWGRALEKVTDLALLNDMEQWRLASELPPEDVSGRARTLAEEARSHRRAGELGAAEDRLQLAARLAEPYAPLYYELGQVKQARGDTSAARQDFLRARELDSSYAAPEVEVLRHLVAQKKYETALSRADSLLQQQSYWLLYLPKARTLMKQARYAEARDVLRGRCEPLNDESYALYALLAKTYVGMEVWDGVQWAVQQAEALSPRRSVFVEHMAAVRATAAERDLSLTEAAGDSMSVEELREHADTTRGIGTVGGGDDP